MFDLNPFHILTCSCFNYVNITHVAYSAAKNVTRKATFECQNDENSTRALEHRYSRTKWLEDMSKIRATLKDTSEKEFRDLFRSLSLRLEDVTSEFAGDDRFVRRDWYYDRTAWRSDLTNCCVTESQLYFAMHRFQHDALDWIAIGDVLPDMDRRDFLRGAKLNERATIPDLGTHVVFFSEGYKETLLRDAGVNMLRAFPSICKFVGLPHDGRIVQVPKKTAQWLRVAAAHHFDDAVRGYTLFSTLFSCMHPMVNILDSRALEHTGTQKT